MKHLFDGRVRTLHRDKILDAGEGIALDEGESEEEYEEIKNIEKVNDRGKGKRRRQIPISDRVLRSHNAN